MATCGIPTKLRGACSKAARVIIAIWCIFTTSLIPGCVLPGRTGAPRIISHLQHLQAQVATKADVLMAVGEPSGSGAARLSPEMAPREVWFYDFNALNGNTIERQILLIFFDKERYDGHLTYSFTNTMKKL
jgi:hypothetical protein